MPVKDPMHPEEITPEWLTHALRGGGVIKEASVVSVDRDILGEGVGFLSGVVRAHIEYDTEEGAPSSVVVKIEPEDGEFQEFGDELDAFQREIRFYKDVAQNVPVRLPVIYYTVDEPPAYSMVMEDLSSLTPGDQIVGMHASQVMDTVSVLAKIQASYWNNSALEKLNWMPVTNAMGKDFNEKWDSFVEHYGDILSPEGLAVGEKLRGSLDWKKNEIERRPKTIVHSDLREDNILFGPQNSDSHIIILDWQLTVRSIGAFDVARLISGSEIPKERTGHEFEVLRKWHGTLLEEGVRGLPVGRRRIRLPPGNARVPMLSGSFSHCGNRRRGTYKRARARYIFTCFQICRRNRRSLHSPRLISRSPSLQANRVSAAISTNLGIN